MPIYDFHCPACGHRFEALVRASDSPPVCPQCNNALDRLVSAPAPPGKSKAIIASNRRAAARAGHFSNYSKEEQSKLLR